MLKLWRSDHPYRLSNRRWLPTVPNARLHTNAVGLQGNLRYHLERKASTPYVRCWHSSHAHVQLLNAFKFSAPTKVTYALFQLEQATAFGDLFSPLATNQSIWVNNTFVFFLDTSFIFNAHMKKLTASLTSSLQIIQATADTSWR